MAHECQKQDVLDMIRGELTVMHKKLDAALRFKYSVIGIVTGVTSVAAMVLALLKL